MNTIARRLAIDCNHSFFLWGPRQTGKSTLLWALFPEARRIDLLKTDEQTKYLIQPSRLREELLLLKPGSFSIIDEVQKVPALLDEVHWLIENHGAVFGLCGSSARKLKHAGANLLGGRAARYELHGLVSRELGESFALERMLNTGYLPRAYLSEDYRQVLNSYVSDYLKEEIADEGAVRNLPAFADFLRIAAVTDTEIVNFTNIASDCGVAKSTAQSYFEILVDTLLGRFLPAFTRRAKRRVVHAPRWYMADVGLVNFLAKRGTLSIGSELFGKAFENFIFHELCAANAYLQKYAEFSYWRLSSGAEVDFIVNDVRFAIECKAVKSVGNHHLKGLREIAAEHSGVGRRIIVSLEGVSRITEDKIEILTLDDFLQQLWEGELL